MPAIRVVPQRITAFVSCTETEVFLCQEQRILQRIFRLDRVALAISFLSPSVRSCGTFLFHGKELMK